MNKDIFREINQSKYKYEIVFVLGTASTIIGFLLFMSMPPLGFILFAGGAILSIFGKSGHKKVVSKLKDTVIRSILNDYVTNAVYRTQPGISSDIVYESEVLRKASRFTSEDYIGGEISNIHFLSSDLHLEELRSDGKNSHYVTTFKGQFYQFEFNKNFNGRTFVMEGSMPSLFHGYEKIKLESEHFNSVFNVYSNSEHDAFYILTPHFMESLLELEATHSGKISLSFIGNRLNIAIYNNVDTFKCSMFRNYDETLIDEFKNDLLKIKHIIESLKLDRVIYKEK